MKPSRRALVKEFCANLGDRRNLTFYVRERWVPFGERAISQLFRIREGRDYTEYEKLQKNLNFEEIEKELTRAKGSGRGQRPSPMPSSIEEI